MPLVIYTLDDFFLFSYEIINDSNQALSISYHM